MILIAKLATIRLHSAWPARLLANTQPICILTSLLIRSTLHVCQFVLWVTSRTKQHKPATRVMLTVLHVFTLRITVWRVLQISIGINTLAMISAQLKPTWKVTLQTVPTVINTAKSASDHLLHALSAQLSYPISAISTTLLIQQAHVLLLVPRATMPKIITLQGLIFVYLATLHAFIVLVTLIHVSSVWLTIIFTIKSVTIHVLRVCSLPTQVAQVNVWIATLFAWTSQLACTFPMLSIIKFTLTWCSLRA